MYPTHSPVYRKFSAVFSTWSWRTSRAMRHSFCISFALRNSARAGGVRLRSSINKSPNLIFMATSLAPARSESLRILVSLLRMLKGRADAYRDGQSKLLGVLLKVHDLVFAECQGNP